MPRASRTAEQKQQAGARLAETIQALNLSKGDAADMMGIGKTTLSNYLKGTRMVDVLAMIRLRAAKGVTLDFVYCDSFVGLNSDFEEAVLKIRAKRRPFRQAS